MPDLYIANCTKQPHDFVYRLPEVQKMFSQPINPGSQIKLNLPNPAAIDAVVNQHARYGMVDVKTLRKGKEYNGLVYSVEKPLNVNQIVEGLNHNDEALDRISLDARQAAAVSLDDHLSQTARDAGASLSGFEVEVIEQKKGPTDQTPKFKQTISVEREGRKSRRK